ncbi:DUF6428 family protein [Gemmatimonas phototrophica]|uniref:Uncharacterized protein n=1 Tax=Gemmatimonas phototrophica TaxID=1379270 RepID=A0A143BPB2_9BACT|nr:DUF6428 family protein [Gemmatimonas phototrophica]AMW06402.1 hypothetical protein GEMMAAP_19630 [Gemmatimonas phototrophica]
MLFADFAAELAKFPEHELVFTFGDTTIGRGYHLTEVLRLTVDAVDCGGAQDHWKETVLQLVDSPAVEGRAPMSAKKVGGILRRSQAMVPLVPDSELVLEFRPVGALAAQRYHVSEIVSGAAGSLRVVTHGARTQCKAAERSGTVCGADKSAGGSSRCCAPRGASGRPRAAVRCCA